MVRCRSRAAEECFRFSVQVKKARLHDPGAELSAVGAHIGVGDLFIGQQFERG